MLRLFIVPLGLLALLGCGPGDPTVAVTGKVTFDGQLVGDGTDAVIRFEPTDKKGNSAESFLTNGQYTVRLVPGAYKVRLTWSKSSGKKRGNVAGPGAEAEGSVQMMPDKYNAKSELTCTVPAAGGPQDFTLAK
jgi:hypothetical protein